MKIEKIIQSSVFLLLIDGFFLILISSIFHFLFSKFGLNPTDDGFILAGSRRILNGEIPHRDFISIRPPGSYFLHVIWLILSPTQAIIISRYFIWLEFSIISCCWVKIFIKILKIKIQKYFEYLLIIFSICFSVHTFPIMPWPTIDALFISSIGILLTLSKSKINVLGSLFIGFSILFRLNFIILIPVSLLILKKWKNFPFLLLMILPSLLYISYLVFFNATIEAFIQLTSYTNFLYVGILKYIIIYSTFFGIIIGFFIINSDNKNQYLNKKKFFNRIYTCDYIILFSILFSSLIFMSIYGYLYIDFPSFSIFGLLLGIILQKWFYHKYKTILFKYLILLLFTAWCSSLSLGYNSPVFLNGPIITFMILLFIKKKFKIIFIETQEYKRIDFKNDYSRNIFILKIICLVFCIVTPLCFTYSRSNHIYRETPINTLVYELNDELIGADDIYVDNNTYDFFRDLKNIKEKLMDNNSRYCIIPDVAINWINDPQPNPLIIDWPQSTELSNHILEEKVFQKLKEQKGHLYIIIQKYEVSELANGKIPLDDEKYSIVDFVHSNFIKVNETEYFDIYY